MRSAEVVLAIMRDRGRRGLVLEDVYRQLYNPELYLLAYGKIARNDGALTPGVTGETSDGMSLVKIERIIDQLRDERYRWTPVRRIHIPKGNGRRRPLGIPTWSDKLLQEVVRLILEAYYEPQFSAHSHGFRPERGCHSALQHIQRGWKGTVWFIEGDISACFDRLDHDVLLAILGERIHDQRFLRLVGNLLKAGYLEEWRYQATLSGTPQGGIVSPILANIYLDRLDQFVEQTLLPRYSRGARRRTNPAYSNLKRKVTRRRRRGQTEEAKELFKALQRLPYGDPHDPAYRRLRYVRYADDFLLGFAGPRQEAEAIREQIGQFLRAELKLELSASKTLITHGQTERARFLGYEISVYGSDTKHTAGRRSINGVIRLGVPVDVVQAKCRWYMRRGKPVHRALYLGDAVYTILATYQQEYRGFVAYYRLAHDGSRRLSRLKWVMEQSLVKTLACKLKLSVRKVYARYGCLLATPNGPYKGLEVRVERVGRAPLVAQWGGISLRRQRHATLNDQPAKLWWNARTELVERLLADRCELCGSRDRVQVHHVRRLRDLQQRREKPAWIEHMIQRQRKTLVVCHSCHRAIHDGRWDGSRMLRERV